MAYHIQSRGAQSGLRVPSWIMWAGIGVSFVGPALSRVKIVEARTKHILTDGRDSHTDKTVTGSVRITP